MLREVKTHDAHYFTDERGFKQGEYKYYDNGKLKIHCFFLDNLRHGEYKDWRPSGQLWEHSFYTNGKQHGIYRVWHENGDPLVYMNFVNGVKHGEYKSWHRDGHLTKHCFFVNGDEISLDKIPYPTTLEELMLFKLKYDLPLLADTTAHCVIITAS